MLLTRHRVLVALIAALVLFSQPVWRSEGPGRASAFGIYPAGSSGMDISYPACEDPLPAAPTTFAIIGVTGGRAYTMNPCLIKQFAWAKTSQVTPSFFMNVNSPSGAVAFEGKNGPKGTCAATDDMCLSYNFGWNAARLAYAGAQSQETTATMWWLDVEEMNTWSETNLPANAQVIQAAIDYLKSQNRTLGIYSTSKQWGEIAGGFSPGLPVWVAGAPDSATAPTYCDASHAFAGGTVWLVQYPSGDTGGDDADYACGAAPVPAGQPTGFLATAVNSTTIQLTWTAPPAPVDTYSITTGVTTTVVRAPATNYTIGGLAPNSYHCYAIAAQSGTFFSGWSSYSCLTTPSGP